MDFLWGTFPEYNRRRCSLFRRHCRKLLDNLFQHQVVGPPPQRLVIVDAERPDDVASSMLIDSSAAVTAWHAESNARIAAEAWPLCR